MQQEVRTLTSVDLRVTTTDKQDLYGAIGTTGDERIFRYASVGATAVTQGQLLSTPATGTNFLGLSVQGAAAVGATQVNLTLSGTATTTDQFLEGNLDLVSGTGAGTSYKVKGNSSQTSTSGVVQVFLSEPLIAAIDTTTKVNLSPNQWSGLTSQIALGSANPNPRIAGAATTAFVANAYGWVQCEGRCMLINDGQTALFRGLTVVLSITTAGRVTLTNASSDADKQVVGNALEASAATAGLFVPVYLTII
jgi:hypothetical protein